MHHGPILQRRVHGDCYGQVRARAFPCRPSSLANHQSHRIATGHRSTRARATFRIRRRRSTLSAARSPHPRSRWSAARNSTGPTLAPTTASTAVAKPFAFVRRLVLYTHCVFFFQIDANTHREPITRSRSPALNHPPSSSIHLPAAFAFLSGEEYPTALTGAGRALRVSALPVLLA